MTCFLPSHERVESETTCGRPSRDFTRKRISWKGKRPQMSRLSPFVLNDLVLSLFSLKCPFRPVLCHFCPSHKRLKFAKTVLFLPRSRTVNITKCVCRDCPIYRIVEQNISSNCLIISLMYKNWIISIEGSGYKKRHYNLRLEWWSVQQRGARD